MNSQPVLKKKWGLDIRVVLTFIILIILSVIILSFELTSRVTCGPIKITAHAGDEHKLVNFFHVNENISFTCSMEGAKKIEWNFGDGSPAFGSTVTHYFLNEGNYLITVTVNNSCSEFLKIIVRKPRDPSLFIENSNQNNQTGSIDNGFQNYKIDVSTYDLGPLPTPLNQTQVVVQQILGDNYQQIPVGEWERLLRQVVDGKLGPDDFKTYLCRGKETLVEANGKMTTFAGLCEDLKKKKKKIYQFHLQKARIKSVVQQMEPDKDNKCVSLLKVSYDW